MDVVTLIGNAVLLSALVPIGLFIFYYGSEPVPGSRWRRRYSKRWKSTSIGRVLMTQKIVWFLFLIFVAVQAFFPEYAGREIVRLILFIGLVSQFWLVFGTLRQIQRNPPIETDDGRSGTADEQHPRGPTFDLSIPGAVGEQREGK
jgi:hypothetical protein